MNDQRVLSAAVTIVVLALLATGCGGGGGGKNRNFELPAGAAFDTTATSRVLIAVETHNECNDAHECAATTSGPCELGSGNVRGLTLYQIGTNGLFFQNPTDPRPAAAPFATIGTADQPRRVVVHPNDPTLLYVATLQRVQVFRLGPGGTARCIAQTSTQQELSPDVKDDLDPIDLAIDPTFGPNGILYVGASGVNRVDAFPIATDGTIPNAPSSCAVGSTDSEYAAVTLATSGFVVAAGRIRIDVYARTNGQFPPRMTTGTSPTIDTSCAKPTLVTQPTSTIGGAFVTDAVFFESPGSPSGRLFIAEEVSRRLLTFPIDTNGVIAADDDSRTDRVGVPQNLLFADRNGPVVYASNFSEGRVDAWRIENNLLTPKTFTRTAEDPDTLPVGLALDAPTGMLYVAEGGRGRIDGFPTGPDGSLPNEPVTSTGPMIGPTGKTIDSFPNDLVIIPLP